jgi:hypothetical protein
VSIVDIKVKMQETLSEIADELDTRIKELDARLTKTTGVAMKAEANFLRVSKML